MDWLNLEKGDPGVVVVADWTLSPQVAESVAQMSELVLRQWIESQMLWDLFYA